MDNRGLCFRRARHGRPVSGPAFLFASRRRRGLPGERGRPRPPVSTTANARKRGTTPLPVNIAPCGNVRAGRPRTQAPPRLGLPRLQTLLPGAAAAIAYTLIETAKLNGFDPRTWIADILNRIHDRSTNRMHRLMPATVDVDSFPGSAGALAGMRGSATEKKMPARAPTLPRREPGTVSIDDPWYHAMETEYVPGAMRKAGYRSSFLAATDPACVESVCPRAEDSFDRLRAALR